jgi:uncharacterized protein (TIRG00374 family)
VAEIVPLVERFQRVYLLYFLLLSLAYEIVRCAEWHFLLRALGIRAPLRTSIFTFTVGEVTRDLPIGNYVPAYVLQRGQGTDFGLASSASLLTMLVEVAVCLAAVLVIGIDDWIWLRPLILIGCVIFALLAWILYRWHHLPHEFTFHPRLQRVMRYPLARRALDELRQFAQGEVTLLRPTVVGISAALAATYLILGGLGIFLVIAGLGLSLPWYQALAVYCVSVALAAIAPMPMDIGTIELGGTGALIALGLTRSAAVSVVLLNRVLSFGAVLVLASIVFALLSGEARQALEQRSAQRFT